MYYLKHARLKDIPQMYEVLKEAASGLGGPVHSDTIRGFIKPTRLAVVLEDSEAHIAGVSLSKFVTRGVCYHYIFAVRKKLRGHGLGGSMIVGTMRYLASKILEDGNPNPHHSHKWFASYPDYNVGVDELYVALDWHLEGTLIAHTKNKTNLIVRSCFPGCDPFPLYWHELHPKEPEMSSLLLKTEGDKMVNLFDLPSAAISDSKNGDIW